MFNIKELERLKAEATEALKGKMNLDDIEALRVKVLGKKGEMTNLLKSLKELSKEERPKIGQILNETRGQLETLLQAKREELLQKELTQKLIREKIDVTLPGRTTFSGHLHPLTLTLRQVKQIFLQMGFSIEEGPEIETDYFNFEALNLPKDHPAREMQDSFYLTNNILLRTQTSPVQARTMQKNTEPKPIRMIAPGRVYRRDTDDASHSSMFTQVEGLVVDKHIQFSDLKGTLEFFLQEIFGKNIGIRFRPSYFPFTEPSAEVDISCVMCHGKGCRVCKGTGWLEILGSGMVHQNVLRESGYDPEIWSGFAFGLGIERIAMLLNGIDDMRVFFENDVRFLEQFK